MSHVPRVMQTGLGAVSAVSYGCNSSQPWAILTLVGCFQDFLLQRCLDISALGLSTRCICRAPICKPEPIIRLSARRHHSCMMPLTAAMHAPDQTEVFGFLLLLLLSLKTGLPTPALQETPTGQVFSRWHGIHYRRTGCMLLSPGRRHTADDCLQIIRYALDGGRSSHYIQYLLSRWQR